VIQEGWCDTVVAWRSGTFSVLLGGERRKGVHSIFLGWGGCLVSSGGEGVLTVVHIGGGYVLYVQSGRQEGLILEGGGGRRN